MEISRLLFCWSAPKPGTFGPLNKASVWGAFEKKNFTASQFRSLIRKSTFVLNWSSRKLDGMEPEYRPPACGVGIRNCSLGSFTFKSARAMGLTAGTMNLSLNVNSERSLVRPGEIKTSDDKLFGDAA